MILLSWTKQHLRNYKELQGISELFFYYKVISVLYLFLQFPVFSIILPGLAVSLCIILRLLDKNVLSYNMTTIRPKQGVLLPKNRYLFHIGSRFHILVYLHTTSNKFTLILTRDRWLIVIVIF